MKVLLWRWKVKKEKFFDEQRGLIYLFFFFTAKSEKNNKTKRNQKEDKV